MYLHFTCHNILVCYMHSPHLISIIKRHHHLPQRQCPSSTTLRFQQQFVLDDTPFQIDLIHFSSHPRLLLQYLKYSRIPMGMAVDVVSSKFLFVLFLLIITTSPTLIWTHHFCVSGRVFLWGPPNTRASIFSIKVLYSAWYTIVISTNFTFTSMRCYIREIYITPKNQTIWNQNKWVNFCFYILG